jgi:hypothetical protein
MKKEIAPDAAEGKSIACSGCGALIAVPRVPVAAVAAASPSSPDQAPNLSEIRAAKRRMWLRYGIYAAAFVVICLFFAFIGAALNRGEPGLAGSRMARKVGAPLALLLIGGVELGLWLWKSQSDKRDDAGRR